MVFVYTYHKKIKSFHQKFAKMESENVGDSTAIICLHKKPTSFKMVHIQIYFQWVLLKIFEQFNFCQQRGRVV